MEPINRVCYKSVLTNGIVDLDIMCSRFDCGVNPGTHIVSQDGFGNYYIDGILARIEIRAEKE